MRRREFIAGLGGVAATWPLAARAQQEMPVIGFLRNTSQADSAPLVTSFRQGLNEAGFIEGQNVAIEYRYAENQVDRLPALVADLLRRPVALERTQTRSIDSKKRSGGFDCCALATQQRVLQHNHGPHRRRRAPYYARHVTGSQRHCFAH